MLYRVGQRVRLLHHQGEGHITELLDAKHVEVDLGEDFPIEVHIDEIVPIDSSQSSFYTLEKPEKEAPLRIFGNLFELSLAVTLEENEEALFHLINPEPIQVLFTCYAKINHKYQGMAMGKAGHKEIVELFSLPSSEVSKIKSLYFQILSFKQGTGHPHAPEICEIPWSKKQLQQPTSSIEALKQKGWLFPVRKAADEIEKAIEKAQPMAKIPIETFRREKVVDLHIEKLVDKPHLLAPSEMLSTQLKEADSSLVKALAENCGAIVFIHGIGNGTLRKEIISLLRSFKEVQEIHPGNPAKYGNGATRAVLE